MITKSANSSGATTQDTKDNTTEQLIHEFIGPNADYYVRQFAKIGEAPGFRLTFNPIAAVLGPLWYGVRNLWNWVLPFMVLEVIALIPFCRGLWSDLAAGEKARAAGIAKILAERQEQAAEAIKTGASNAESLQRAAESLEKALQESLATAEAISGNAILLIITGIVLLVLFKVIQGVLANWVLERRFTRWRSDQSLTKGVNIYAVIGVTLLAGIVYIATIMRFTITKPAQILTEFPTDKYYNLTVADTIKSWFAHMSVRWDSVFDSITLGIKALLDSLELMFVGTPWLVVMPIVVFLAGRAAGIRVAIFTGAALLYLGFMGFWANAMATVALLGAAACISIFFGIPIGILCARKPKVFAVVRPVLDFMQTMPSFVYLIPVIAFFGTGKPAGIIATLVFGSPPVIRMTVLGLKGVPESVREAAIAFGASPRFILFKVDLPLAAPSIMAGINQTIMLSLSMVVIASLIGAKGLGEEVLEALQYASEGKGILAGFAILFCAMILDRVVQGRLRN